MAPDLSWTEARTGSFFPRLVREHSIHGKCGQGYAAKNGSEWGAKSGEAGNGEDERAGKPGWAESTGPGSGPDVNEKGVGGGRGLLGWEDGGPPAGADTEIPDGKEACHGDDQNQNRHADPAQADLLGVVALDAGAANVGGKCRPAAVVVDDPARGAGGLEEALGPVVLVDADGGGVAA